MSPISLFRRRFIKIFSLGAAGWLLFTAPVLNAANVTVFAAASLTDALKEIATNYEKKGGDKGDKGANKPAN